VKDIDFLPEWYKDRRRRHCMVRRQYIALAAIFVGMMTFNVTAMYRATRVAADLARHADRQMSAEAVVHEFDRVTKELNQMKTKADLVRRIDTRFDVAAILAEISHIVDESVVLSKIQMVAEPVIQAQAPGRGKGTKGRAADKGEEAQPEMPLGDAKLRLVLAGVSVYPASAAELVWRLDESPYFQRVSPSFYDKTKIPAQPSSGTAGAKSSETRDVTSFEITCYLANYRETEVQ
jgi:hypothetical protein